MSSRTIRRGKASAGNGPPASGTVLASILTLAVVLGATGACSSGGHPASTAGSPPSPTGTPTAPASSPAPRVLDEHARLTGVTVRTGSTVVVQLHSTYWSTPTTSDPDVLVPGAGGSSPAGSCPPGGGCGVSSARFTAARPGTARVTAHRSSCGEAMRCLPGQRAYEVTVTVTG